MNVIQLANFIIYAVKSPSYRYFFLSTHQADSKHKRKAYSLQYWFEEHFSLPQADTTCFEIYETECQPHPHCYDQWWENPPNIARINLWKLATREIVNFQARQQDDYNAIKTQIMREVLRLTQETRTELDRQYEEVFQSTLHVSAAHAESRGKFVTLHIRRTDKVGSEHHKGEASLANSTTFLECLAEQLNLFDGMTLVPVFAVTDGEEVKQEFESALKHEANKGLNKKLRVIYRYAPTRPDRLALDNSVSESYYRLLLDIRLMLHAHVFIGSQSSNLGVLACMLRVHHNCFSVESPRFHWNPRKNKSA